MGICFLLAIQLANCFPAGNRLLSRPEPMLNPNFEEKRDLANFDKSNNEFERDLKPEFNRPEFNERELKPEFNERELKPKFNRPEFNKRELKPKFNKRDLKPEFNKRDLKSEF